MDLDDAEQRALLVEERKRGTDRRLLRVRATAGVVFAVAILVTFFGGLESGRWTESDAGFGNDMRMVRIVLGVLVVVGLFFGERWARRDRFPYLGERS